MVAVSTRTRLFANALRTRARYEGVSDF
ncbi:MAG: hypothetical protein QOE54_4018, partial [Streptosporangiaceae bacterium]|nr:hypothetical protein [Streptosporangiaceae bacterium]